MRIPNKFSRVAISPNDDGIPRKGLVLYHPLTEMLATTPTGQTCTLTGSTYNTETYRGIPCIRFNNKTYIEFPAIPKAAGKSWVGAWSLWLAHPISLAGWISGQIFKIGTGAFTGYGTWFGCNFNNAAAAATNIGACTWYSTSGKREIIAPYSDLSWHHLVMNCSLTGDYNHGILTADAIYDNGIFKTTLTTTCINNAFVAIGVGSSGSKASTAVCLAALRIYNRHLTEDEVLALYSEFTPTT